ncbi:MAG: penicillin-binding protein 2, partial [Armatimonadetes bacterium]|nr:penicillin-binding protein 2 [Armatimonadota bacterium]
WYLGETYNASIGQGFILTTPAQLARMMSVLANGGLLYRLELERLEKRPLAESYAVISGKTFDLIEDALVGAVNEEHGTGWAARSKLAKVGGKTGTAQVISLKKRRELERLGI